MGLKPNKLEPSQDLEKIGTLGTDFIHIPGYKQEISFKGSVHRRPMTLQASTKTMNLSVGSEVSGRSRIDLKADTTFLRSLN